MNWIGSSPSAGFAPAEGRFILEGDGAARVFDKIEGIDKISIAIRHEAQSRSEAAEGKRDKTSRRFIVARMQGEKALSILFVLSKN